MVIPCGLCFLDQAAAEDDAQSVVAAASAAGCSAWFLAHAPLLLAASPRGAAALRRPLPHAGGDQVSSSPGNTMPGFVGLTSDAAAAARMMASGVSTASC